MPDRLLDEEIALSTRMLSLLEEEQLALKCGDTASLEKSNLDKQVLMVALNEASSKREAFFAAASNISNPKDAIAAWLAKQDKQTAIRERLNTLLAIAKQIKHVHNINAKLIGMHLDHTNRALDILQGDRAKTPLYGSNGMTLSTGSSRIMDLA